MKLGARAYPSGLNPSLPNMDYPYDVLHTFRTVHLHVCPLCR